MHAMRFSTRQKTFGSICLAILRADERALHAMCLSGWELVSVKLLP